MINYDSILSAFDGKPTLLQWLKMVKKALDESILKNVNITQNGQKVVFTFNFEDGTSISTPEVTLPKGDKGDKGENGVSVVSFTFDSYQVLANNTETTYKMTLSNGTETNFVIFAKNGKDGINGNDGVSITDISAVGNEVVGDETLTTIRANYSNNTNDEFIVTAKNGKNAVNIYRHLVALLNENSYQLRFICDSQKSNLSLEDALNQIPSLNGIISFYAQDQNTGIVSVLRNGQELNMTGFVNDITSGGIIYYYNSFIPVSINDSVIGINL